MNRQDEEEQGHRGRGWSYVLLATAVLLIAAALAVAWLPRGKERQREARAGDDETIAMRAAGNETPNREWPPPEVTLELSVEGADTARFAAAEGDRLIYRDRVQGFSMAVLVGRTDRERGFAHLEVFDRRSAGAPPDGARCGRGSIPAGKTIGLRCGGVDLRVQNVGFDEYWTNRGSVVRRASERCQVTCGSTIASGPLVKLTCVLCYAR